MKSLLATIAAGVVLVPVVSAWAGPSIDERFKVDRAPHVDLLAARDAIGKQAIDDDDRPVVPPALLAATDPDAAPAPGFARPVPDEPVAPESRVIIVESPSGIETEVVESWNKPLFVSGAIAFGVSYGGSLIVASTSDRREDRNLLVPIAGPWMDLSERGDCKTGARSCDGETTAKVLLVADGIIQGGSVIAMAAGLLTSTRHKVVTETTAKKSKKKTKVIPISGSATGLAVRGVW